MTPTAMALRRCAPCPNSWPNLSNRVLILIALTPKTKKPPFGGLHFESIAFLAVREGLMLAALRAENTPNGAASLRSSSKFVAEFVERGSLPNRPHPKNQKTPFRGSSLRINSIFGGERGIDACALGAAITPAGRRRCAPCPNS